MILIAANLCKYAKIFSAIFLETRLPVRRIDRRKDVALAPGRDRQRLSGIEQVEQLIFERVPRFKPIGKRGVNTPCTMSASCPLCPRKRARRFKEVRAVTLSLRKGSAGGTISSTLLGHK